MALENAQHSLSPPKCQPQPWMTEKQAAEYLGVSASFLSKNRCYSPANEVIPYVRLSSRCIRYDFNQLQGWLNDQISSFKEETTNG